MRGRKLAKARCSDIASGLLCVLGVLEQRCPELISDSLELAM